MTFQDGEENIVSFGTYYEIAHYNTNPCPLASQILMKSVKTRNMLRGGLTSDEAFNHSLMFEL